MARGQAAPEFMLMFAATLAVMAVLSAALLAEREGILEKKDAIEHINRAEAAARAVEAMLNSGVKMDFSFADEGVKYGVEDGRLHVAYRGKVIEVGGVYAGNATEPV
jgi:hypothetical protein